MDRLSFDVMVPYKKYFLVYAPSPLKILLLMSPVVIEGNNLHNLCKAPAPAPAPCIAVSLFSSGRFGIAETPG